MSVISIGKRIGDLDIRLGIPPSREQFSVREAKSAIFKIKSFQFSGHSSGKPLHPPMHYGKGVSFAILMIDAFSGPITNGNNRSGHMQGLCRLVHRQLKWTVVLVLNRNRVNRHQWLEHESLWQ